MFDGVLCVTGSQAMSSFNDYKGYLNLTRLRCGAPAVV